MIGPGLDPAGPHHRQDLVPDALDVAAEMFGQLLGERDRGPPMDQKLDHRGPGVFELGKVIKIVDTRRFATLDAPYGMRTLSTVESEELPAEVRQRDPVALDDLLAVDQPEPLGPLDLGPGASPPESGRLADRARVAARRGADETPPALPLGQRRRDADRQVGDPGRKGRPRRGAGPGWRRSPRGPDRIPPDAAPRRPGRPERSSIVEARSVDKRRARVDWDRTKTGPKPDQVFGTLAGGRRIDSHYH